MPDKSLGYNVTIDLETRKAQAKAGEFARDLHKRIAAAVKALPDIELDADASAAQRRIAEIRRELATLRTKRIGIDVDATAASTRLGQLSGELRRLTSQSPNVQVRADTAAASAALSGVRRQAQALDGQRVNIAVNANDVHRAIGIMGLLTAGIAGVGAAAPAAAAAVAAIPAAAGVAAQGIGALAVGFSGVGDAVKALEQADKSAATTATSGAASRVAAAQRIESAQHALARAQQQADRQAIIGAEQVAQALEQVEDAERSVTRAQEQARDAQLDLNRARAEAREELEDLALSLRGAALSEEQAQLRLIEAQERLAEARAAGVSSRDLQELDLDARQAALSLDEARERHADLREESAHAARVGVEGSDQVVAAHRRVRDAGEAVREAEANLAQAHADVARAQRDASWAQQDALDQVAEAQRQLAAAMVATGATGAAAMTNLASAMDKLSPAGQQFARFLHGELLPGLRGIRDAVQETLLPRMETSLRTLMQLSPVVSAGLAETGRVIGDLSVRGAQMMTSGPWRADFATIMASNNRILGDFGNAGLSLADAFRSITVEAGPLLERFSQFAERGAAAFNAWIQGARASGELSAFFSQAGDTLATLGGVLGQVALAALQVAQALGPMGMVLLQTVGHVAQTIGAFAQANPLITQFVAAGLLAASMVIKLGSGIGGLGASVAGAAAGFRALGPAALASNAAMTWLSVGMQTAALSAGTLTERLTGSANAGTRVASAGNLVGSTLTAVGSSLPLVGIAVAGLAIAYDGLTTSSGEAASAMERGGQASVDAVQQLAVQGAMVNMLNSIIPGLGVGYDLLTTDLEEYRAGAQGLNRLLVEQAIALNNLIQLENQGLTGSPQWQAAQAAYAAATDRVAAAKRAAADATKSLTDRITEQQNLLLGATNAEIAYRDQLHSLTVGLQQNGLTFDINTEAGRRNLQSLTGVIGASGQFRQALIDQGMSEGFATQKAWEHRESLINAMVQLGMTRGEAQALIDKYMQIPPRIDTSVHADTGPASREIFSFLDAHSRHQLTVRVRADTGNILAGARPMAIGGAVYGPGTATSDSINARLSRGEHVWTAREVRGAGGHGRVERLRDMAATGRLPAFARGGMVAAGPRGSALPGTLPIDLADPAKATNAFGQLGKMLADVLAPALDAAKARIAPGTDMAAAIQALVAIVPTLTDATIRSGADIRSTWAQNTGAVTAAQAQQTGQYQLLAANLGAATLGMTQHVWTMQGNHNASWADIAARCGAAIAAITGPQFGGLHGGMNAVQQHATHMASWVGGEFGRIVPLTANPIRWSLDWPINRGLVPAWNVIDRHFALGRPMGPVPIGFATGGKVGGSGSGDTVPAMLTPGEFVVRKQIAEPTEHFLEALNAGQAEAFQAAGGRHARFAAGGPVERGQAFAASQHGKPYVWGGVGPRGYDCCIVGGVRVYGPDGERPIRDIRAGDRVYSYVDGRLDVHTVTAAWQSKRQPVFSVRTRNRTVIASANHPFLVVKEVADRVTHREDAAWPGIPEGLAPYGSRRGVTCSVSACSRSVWSRGMCNMHDRRHRTHGDPRIFVTTGKRYDVAWSRLDELRRGDLLVQPRTMTIDAKPDPELADGTSVDADIAWLIGTCVGDGTVTDKGLRLCLYGDQRDRAAEIINRHWSGKCGYHQSAGLVISNRRLCDALTALGMRRLGPEKRVPEAAKTWPGDLRRAFLDGYCDADGHHPSDQARHGERTYSSASEDLIGDVRAIHLALGDPVSNVSVDKRTKPITIKGEVVRHARPLYSFTVWAGGRGGGEVALRERSGGLSSWLDAGDFTLVKALGIRSEGEQDTYDIEVEGAHNFIADGVVVHNSGFMSAIANVLMGRHPHQRIGTTGSAPWAGWRHGLNSAFGVGFFKGNPGHMAGTLAGQNVEAGGSPSRTKFVAQAAGATHPQFRGHMSLPQVGGVFVGGPGGGYVDPMPFINQALAETRRMIADIRRFHGDGNIAVGMERFANDAVAGAIKWAVDHMPQGDAPGSGPVRDQVRGVSARFGWGDGPQWAALDWLIQKESGWNPRAQNPRSTAFGLYQFLDCLPLDTEILTRDGWKHHDQVHVGDETFGHNPQTGRLEWTQVTEVVTYDEPRPLLELSNGRWSVRCTPTHRWWTQRRSPLPVEALTECPECGAAGGKRGRFVSGRAVATHRAKAHGVATLGSEGYRWVGGFAAADDLTMAHELVLAADAQTDGNDRITADEATILGWVLTDGHIHGDPAGTLTVSIYQSKPEQVDELRKLLHGVPHSVYVRQRQPHHLPAYTFYLHAAYARDLLARSELLVDGPEQFVLGLDEKQRARFLDACVLAEGSIVDYPAGSVARVSQNDGPVQDAIVLAVYLSGYRPSVRTKVRQESHHRQNRLTTLSRPTVHAATLTRREVDPEPVWCVRTELGTWTARQGLHVMLTGNSTWATVGGHKTDNPGLQAEFGNRYIGRRYRDPIGAQAFHRSHNWYDNGGLARGAGWMVKGPRPERMLSPEQTAAFERLVEVLSTRRGMTFPALAEVGAQVAALVAKAQEQAPQIIKNFHLAVHNAANNRVDLEAQFRRLEMRAGV